MMWVLCARIPALSQSTRLTKLTKAFAEWGVPYRLWRAQAASRGEIESDAEVIDGFPFVTLLPKALRYLVWVITVGLKCRMQPRDTVFWCVGFESALPVAYMRRRGQRFVFDNNDNFSKSHNFPAWLVRFFGGLESAIAKRADLHIVPGADRWAGEEENLRIVPNVPSSRSLQLAIHTAVANGFTRPNVMTIYVCGWLTVTRGLIQLGAALDELRRRGRQVVVLVAGASESDDAMMFISRPEVEYLGVVPNEMALALCYRVTAMFTFYDPGIEINRLAEPNKWGDCVATDTPFICNQEIQTSSRYADSGLRYMCGYDDVIGLADQICRVFDTHDFSEAGPKLSQDSENGWEAILKGTLTEFDLLNA